jgi:4-amino-4-deoxy-L-arabinose transferase-like glycosyltransferase
MLLFQEAWLLATWITGASDHPQKLLIVGVVSLAGALAIIFMPQGANERIERLLRCLEGHPAYFFGLLGLILLTIGIFYVNGQRVWTDEDNNFYYSKHLVLDGMTWFWTNYPRFAYIAQHPPLTNLMNGLAQRLFGIHLYVIRWLSVCFSFATLIVVYLLGKTLYNRAVGMFSALFLVSFPLFIRVGTAGMLDVQVTFYFALAILLTIHLLRRPSVKLGLLLGIILGLGLVTKYVFAFVFPVILVLYLGSKKIRQAFFPLLAAGVISCAIFMTWAVQAVKIGVNLPVPVAAHFTQPSQTEVVRPPASGENGQPAVRMDIPIGWFLVNANGRRFILESLVTRLPSAIGLYNYPLILLGGIMLLKRRGKPDLVILAWITLVTLLLLLTLPDHRYFIVIFPALSICMACWTEAQHGSGGRTILLSLLFQIGALYIFIDWNRLSLLF